MIGPPEAVLILALVALFAGPKLLPAVANGLGRTTKSAKAGLAEARPDDQQRSE